MSIVNKVYTSLDVATLQIFVKFKYLSIRYFFHFSKRFNRFCRICMSVPVDSRMVKIQYSVDYGFNGWTNVINKLMCVLQWILEWDLNDWVHLYIIIYDLPCFFLSLNSFLMARPQSNKSHKPICYFYSKLLNFISIAQSLTVFKS